MLSARNVWGRSPGALLLQEAPTDSPPLKLPGDWTSPRGSHDELRLSPPLRQPSRTSGKPRYITHKSWGPTAREGERTQTWVSAFTGVQGGVPRTKHWSQRVRGSSKEGRAGEGSWQGREVEAPLG